jgi:ribosomal protein S6E (S10)
VTGHSISGFAGYFEGPKNYFSGNVGIGTTDPGSKLDIDGQIKIRGGSPGNGKVLTSDASGLANWQEQSAPIPIPLSLSGSSSDPIIEAFNTGSSGSGISGNSDDATGVYGGSSSGKGVYGSSTSGTGVNGYSNNGKGVYGRTSNGYAGYFEGPKNYFSGKVGIGTTTALTKLDVSGSMRVTHDLMIGVSDGFAQSGRLHVDGGQWSKALYVEGADSYFSDDVGIGTESPGAKLDVNGQIKIRGGSPGSGKVLTSDSSGLASWETSPGSPWSTSGSNVYRTSGNVGIGTTEPEEKLHVNGYAKIDSFYTGSAYDVHVSHTNRLIKVTSSKRYKTDIFDLPVNIQDVLNLRPVQFRWKESGQKDIGLIAEEVNEIINDLVVCDQQGQPDSVKYDRLAVYLLKVIKEQQQRINDLEETVTQYESLSERLTTLETIIQSNQDVIKIVAK